MLFRIVATCPVGNDCPLHRNLGGVRAESSHLQIRSLGGFDKRISAHDAEIRAREPAGYGESESARARPKLMRAVGPVLSYPKHAPAW